MSKLQCSKCLAIYSFEEYSALSMVKAVESDTDPKSQHGYTPVCKCGAVFHRDKWTLIDHVKTHDATFRVSTTHLELDYSFDGKEPIWYETMIFLDEGHFHLDEPQWRYGSKEEATRHHNVLVRALAEGKYKLRTVQETKALDVLAE